MLELELEGREAVAVVVLVEVRGMVEGMRVVGGEKGIEVG